jgi:hypothetical protein
MAVPLLQRSVAAAPAAPPAAFAIIAGSDYGFRGKWSDSNIRIQVRHALMRMFESKDH